MTRTQKKGEAETMTSKFICHGGTKENQILEVRIVAENEREYYFLEALFNELYGHHGDIYSADKFREKNTVTFCQLNAPEPKFLQARMSLRSWLIERLRRGRE